MKSVCDRAILLAGGTVQAKGSVAATINAYESWLHSESKNTTNGQAPPDGSGGSSRITIRRVEVRRSGEPSNEILKSRDAMDVSVYFDTVDVLHDPRLVIRIVRSDGVTCSMIRTSDLGFELEDLEGSGSISLRIDPIQLAGGTYSIDARLTGQFDGTELAQNHSRHFQVIGPSIGHREDFGVFLPNVKWNGIQAIDR